MVITAGVGWRIDAGRKAAAMSTSAGFRRLLAATSAAVCVGGVVAVSGNSQDRYLEYYLTRGLGGKCYGTLGQLAEERRHRRSAVVPDEFMAELFSVARRIGVPVNRLKLVLVPTLPMPASTGTLVLPGSHAYIVLSDSPALQCLLGGARVVYKTAFPQTHSDPSKCDIDPEQQHMSMSPAERYGIAHEMAHIYHEDYAVRWLSQTTLVLGLLAMPWAGVRFMGWTLRAATMPTLLAVLPAQLALKKLNRMQETRADEYAAKKGYLLGGIEFWRTQLELGASMRPGLIELLSDHPPAYKRLAKLMQMAGYR